jgi:hypothetical protein
VGKTGGNASHFWICHSPFYYCSIPLFLLPSSKSPTPIYLLSTMQIILPSPAKKNQGHLAWVSRFPPPPPHLHHTHLHSDSLWTATSIQGQALWLFISIFQGLVPAFLPPITHVLNVLESGFYSHCHKETKFTESKMTSQLLISKACLLDPSNRWVILFCKLPILCQQVSHSLLPSLPVSPNFQPWPLLCSCSSFFLKITFSLTVGTLGPQI